MADPLSIASGIIAVLTASGHTLQGLEKVWSLRHRSQEFIGLWNQATGVRALLWGTEIALRNIREDAKDTPRIQDCLENIDRLVLQATDIYALLDKAIQEVSPGNGRNPTKKPSKRSWLRRKSKIDQLTTQVSTLTVSLNAALNILQGVQSSVTANQTAHKIDLVLTKVEALATNEALPDKIPSWDTQTSCVDDEVQAGATGHFLAPEPHASNQSLSRRSSWQSFHSAVSNSSDSSGTLVSFSGSLLINTECEDFCPCQCHATTQSRFPSWFTQLFGRMTTHGNGSILLNRQPCNKKHCRKGGSTRLQIAYMAPAWAFSQVLNIYVKAETIAGIIPSIYVCLPRVIPKSSLVWSIIELGVSTELRGMLSRREVSPYDVTIHGVSLLHYAAIKGQDEIITNLLAEKADPFFRDESGTMAIQPAIDRVLSNTGLDRNASGKANSSSEVFVNSKNLDQQGFTLLHLIILGLQCLDLEMILKYYPTDIDAIDVNGRTPLLWAAWRGDLLSVSFLIQYGADINKKDNQSWTSLARASKSGHLSVVKCLLEAGASMAISTSQGFQPIHHASDNKRNGADVVKELLAHGADVNARSNSYETPLHNAANRGSVETIKCLLVHGSTIDATDEDGDTPVMTALLCWNEPAFLYLSAYGARLDIARRSGHSVVHVAVWGASTKVWDLLTTYVETGKLCNIDIGVQHNGHNLATCFYKCRDLWYSGKRDVEAELAQFQGMICALSLTANIKS